MTGTSPWPDLPLSAWSETCETLHRWTQIVGKVRMALAPLLNHWWNVTLYVTSRGLGTSAIPYGAGSFEIIFDFVEHCLLIESSDGRVESIALAPMSVKDFHSEFMLRLQRLDINVHIWTMPSEIENAVPFDQDRTHAQYDPIYVQRFWRSLLQANRVMSAFRAPFVGKVSPVHFFWGSFDLAVTRFSGRPAPPPTGVTPNVANWVIARPIRTRSAVAAFGRAMAVTDEQPFMFTRIQSHQAMVRLVCTRPRPSMIRVLVSSFCPMTSFAPRVIRTLCCWDFCKRLTKPPPIRVAGIVRRWNVQRMASSV